jgi:hypothetical protein
VKQSQSAGRSARYCKKHSPIQFSRDSSGSPSGITLEPQSLRITISSSVYRVTLKPQVLANLRVKCQEDCLIKGQDYAGYSPQRSLLFNVSWLLDSGSYMTLILNNFSHKICMCVMSFCHVDLSPPFQVLSIIAVDRHQVVISSEIDVAALFGVRVQPLLLCGCLSQFQIFRTGRFAADVAHYWQPGRRALVCIIESCI